MPAFINRSANPQLTCKDGDLLKASSPATHSARALPRPKARPASPRPAGPGPGGRPTVHWPPPSRKPSVPYSQWISLRSRPFSITAPPHGHLQELQGPCPPNCPEVVAGSRVFQRAWVAESPEDRPTQVSLLVLRAFRRTRSTILAHRLNCLQASRLIFGYSFKRPLNAVLGFVSAGDIVNHHRGCPDRTSS